MKSASASSQLDGLLDHCRARGVRSTRALRDLLGYLLRHNRPVNFTTLSKEPQIRKICDPSSAFRILVRLEEIGLVRRMASPDRSYYFLLNLPGEHHDYLICTECGQVENLDIACPVEGLEKKIKRRTGYRDLYHELDFFGTCPRCQAA